MNSQQRRRGSDVTPSKPDLKLPEIKGAADPSKEVHTQRAADNNLLASYFNRETDRSDGYKSILTARARSSVQVGLNPNLKPTSTVSHMKIFPMGGLWKD